MSTNKYRLTKQAWYKVNEEVGKVVIERAINTQGEFEYFYIDKNTKQKIELDVNTLKKAYYKGSKVFNSVKVLSLNANNVLVKKSILDDGLQGKELYLKVNKKFSNDEIVVKNMVYKINKGKKQKINVRKLYPNEKELLLQRASFYEMINDFIGVKYPKYGKNNQYDTIMNYNDTKKEKLKDILDLYKDKLSDENGLPLEEVLKKALRNEVFVDFVKELANYLTSEEVNEKLLNDVYCKIGERQKRKLSVIFDVKAKKIGDDIDIDVVISKYPIKNLCEQVMQLDTINVSNIINITKQNYKDNINIEKFKNKEHIYLGKIHDYVKGRYQKLLKIDKCDLERNVTKIYNEEYLTEKIRHSLHNRIKYEKQMTNKREIYGYNELDNETSIYKQLIKAEDSFKLKFSWAISEAIYGKLLDRENDEFGSLNLNCKCEKCKQSKESEQCEKCIQNILNKIKPFMNNDDIKMNLSENEMTLGLLGAYLIRNNTTHQFETFKENKQVKLIVKETEIDINKLKKTFVELKMIQLRDNNCYTFYELDEIKTILNMTKYSNSKSIFLPKFNKVFLALSLKTNANNKNINLEQAQRFLLQGIYNGLIVNSDSSFEALNELLNEKTVESFLESDNARFKQIINIYKETKPSSLASVREEMQKKCNGDKTKIIKYEKQYIQFIAEIFNQIIIVSKLDFIFEEKEGLAEIEPKELEKYITINVDPIESVYCKSIFGLAQFISNSSVNEIINSIKKYQQYINKIVTKDTVEIHDKVLKVSSNGFISRKDIFSDQEEIQVTDLDKLITHLELLLAVKELNNIEYITDNTTIENKTLTFINNISNNSVFKELKDISYKIYDKEMFVDQELFKSGEELIPLKSLIEIERYNYLDEEFIKHQKVMSDLELDYSVILKSYESFYKPNNEFIQKVKAEIQGLENPTINFTEEIREENYIVQLQEAKKVIHKYLKNFYYNRENKDCIKDQGIISLYEFMCTEINDLILKHDFYDNLIHLTICRQAFNLETQMEKYLIAFVSSVRTDNASKINKKQLVSANENDVMNCIIHKNYRHNNPTSIYEVFVNAHSVLDVRTNRRNDLPRVYKNILEKNRIIVDSCVFDVHNSKINFNDASVKPKLHSLFNGENFSSSIQYKLIDETHAQYLYNILKKDNKKSNVLHVTTGSN